jgi:Ca-activated chloride channel family protein
MQATIKLEHDLIALEGEHDVHAMLELAVPEAPGSDRGPPLAIALVIDRSGSMAGEKLANAKRSAQWLVGQLRADDRLALIDYDSEVRLLAPIGPVDARSLAAQIASIRPGSSTNLSGGWLKALEQLRGESGTRKILLLTDGLANVGITDSETLVRLTTGAREEGVGTTTIGFGEGFDEDLLTRTTRPRPKRLPASSPRSSTG